MTNTKVIPMLRIFDYPKAVGLYADWLGFTIEWEHEFEPGMPKYLEVKKGDIVFHLTEHHGDGTPGSHVFIWCEGVREYHAELLAKNYKYNRPGLEETFYSVWSFVVNDPFDNKISFNGKKPNPRTPKGGIGLDRAFLLPSVLSHTVPFGPEVRLSTKRLWGLP